METIKEVTYLQFTDIFMGKRIFLDNVEISKWEAYHRLAFTVDDCMDVLLNDHPRLSCIDKKGWSNGKLHPDPEFFAE